MGVKYTSIQVTPQMRRRLAQYKGPGMSYEAVLGVLTDAIPPHEFHAVERRAIRSIHAQLRESLARSPESAAEEGRRREAERLARLTPFERMEEAVRLSLLLRSFRR